MQNAPHHPAVHNAQSNPMGTAGFVVSLVGLVASCGLLSPIGTVLSFVGMRRQPNGLAIAGFVIGLIGSLWLLVFGIGLVILGIGGVAAMIGLGPLVEDAVDQAAIRSAIQQHRETTGALPASLDELAGLAPEQRTDHWGSPYRLEVSADGASATIISNGPDKQSGTNDDIRVQFTRP